MELRVQVVNKFCYYSFIVKASYRAKCMGGAVTSWSVHSSPDRVVSGLEINTRKLAKCKRFW